MVQWVWGNLRISVVKNSISPVDGSSLRRRQSRTPGSGSFRAGDTQAAPSGLFKVDPLVEKVELEAWDSGDRDNL